MTPSSSQPPSPHPRTASLAPPRASSPAPAPAPSGPSRGDPLRPPSSTLSAAFEPTPRSPSAGHSAATTAVPAAPAPADPPFVPLFTLVEDARARGAAAATHHPAVHYCFAGDDRHPDPVLDALLRLHGAASAPGSPPAERDRARESRAATKTREDRRAAPAKATKTAPVRERYVLVTLDATGRAVAAAHSLTPDWQVLGAAIGPAPMLEGGGGGGGEGGLMLKIEGTEGWATRQEGTGDPEGAGEEEDEEERLEGLIEDYAARMEEMQKVLGKAEGLEAANEDPPDEGEETA